MAAARSKISATLMTISRKNIALLAAIALAGAASPSSASESPLDIAPFARVLSWPPQTMTGTKATRVEEMPAADIFPGKELAPAADGSYRVPIKDGQGCIGLQWDENRMLRRVALQGINQNSGQIELQYWIGESAWQGQWVPVKTGPTREGNELAWTLTDTNLAKGTPKIRWVFSGAQAPLAVHKVSAFTTSKWHTVEVKLDKIYPTTAKTARIDVYNGAILYPTGSSNTHQIWQGGKSLTLKILASVAQPYKADRTVLRFRFTDIAFGVAVEDVESNDAVYVPAAKLLAMRLDTPMTGLEYLDKISRRTTVLEDVRAKPDQQFSRAWDAIHRSVEDIEPTMLSLACDNRKFIVGRDGVIGFNEYDGPDDPPQPPPGWNWLGTSQWQLLPRFGSGQNAQLSRHLAENWLPMPVTTVTENGISYDETTYVAPDGEMKSGNPAWWRDRALCAAEFLVKNNGNEAADAALSFKLVPGRDPKLSFDFQETPEGLLAVREGRIVAMIDTRKIAPMTLQHDATGISLSGRLPAGAVVLCPVFLPAWKVAPADGASLLPDGSWAPQVGAYWSNLFAPAMQIEIPEPRLDNIIRASQVWCAIAARNEDHGALIEPWIASAFYGPLESEANSIIRGMGMTGHEEFAQRSLDYFLGKCNPSGFITTGYTLVGTGEILWTLGEEYQRTRDRAWLRRHAPEIVRICQWITRQRAKTKRLDLHGKKVPEYGLMPPGVTADWGRFAFRFFNDAQYCAGMEMAGEALADIGDPAAPAILKEAKNYKADITRAFHWAQARTPVNALADGTWVPADPSFLHCYGRVEDLYPNEDAGRTWCYSIECGAHHLAANRILDPMSRDAGWMADYLEDTQFLRDSWGGDYPEADNHRDSFDFGGFAKVQPYYCRIAEIYALRDDVKPFIRSYLNAIPSLVNGENLSFCEHFRNFGAWNKTHETGWFLAQTRMMFVMEHGDELWLAPFVNNNWLKNGLNITVRNAPTAFGTVGYGLTSAAADGEIDAVVHLPPHCAARWVVLRLRHPDGKPIQSVTLQGKPYNDFDASQETIAFTPAEETATIRARF